MTVSSSTDRATFAGNGVTAVFPLPFRFFANAEIYAWLIDDATGVLTPQAFGTHYTLVGAAEPEIDGNPESELTMIVAPATGTSLFVQRIIPITQPTDIVNQGSFFPEVHENVFDRLTMLLQQNSGSLDRALRVQDYDPIPDRLPSAVARANLLLGFDSFGNPNAVSPVSGTAADLAVNLANSTDPSKGAALVGYRGRTVKAKLDDSLTVEDFGAVGDGVTNDSAAILAMHAATGGVIRLLSKPYYVGSLSLTASYISLHGEKKPSANSAGTALEDGSILIGTVSLRALVGNVENVGVDVGSSRGFVSPKEGFVFDAPVGQIGRYIKISGFTSLGMDEAQPTHACLVEGFDKGDIDNVDVQEHHYGVVYKGRGGEITRVRGLNMGAATVLAKSDTPANAGNVANGSVSNVKIKCVLSTARAANTTCVGVWVHAATAAISSVSYSDVTQIYGKCAAHVRGASATELTSAVTGDTVSCDQSNTAVLFEGYNYEARCKSIKASNPLSGKAWITDALCVNWFFRDIDLVTTLPALSGLTDPATCLGTGGWDEFNVRNSAIVGSMVMVMSLSSIRSGRKRGNIKISGEGALTYFSGAVAGAVPAAVQLNADNDLRVSGQVNVAAYVGAIPGKIAAVSGSLSFGLERKFAANAQTGGGTYVQVSIYVSGTDIWLLNNAGGGLASVDLSPIVVGR